MISFRGRKMVVFAALLCSVVAAVRGDHVAVAQSPSFSTVPNFGQAANDGSGQTGGIVPGIVGGVVSGIFSKVPQGGSTNVLPGQPASGANAPAGASAGGSQVSSGALPTQTDNLVKELMGRNGEGSSYAKTAIKNLQDVASSDFGKK